MDLTARVRSTLAQLKVDAKGGCGALRAGRLPWLQAADRDAQLSREWVEDPEVPAAAATTSAMAAGASERQGWIERTTPS